MRAQISNRDYEQLSAYIDGQLSPAERRKLEERLRARTDLQVALDEMNRTRTLLRSAPRRRAPRNFTLTPAMVGERKPRQPWLLQNMFPVLSFTSALAMLVLVATIVLQLLPGTAGAAPVAMQPQADQVQRIVQATMTVVEATAQASAPQLAAPPAPAPQTANPAAGQAPSTAEKAAPAATEAPMIMQAQPEATATATAEATASAAAAAASAVPAATAEGVMQFQIEPTETLAPTAPPPLGAAPLSKSATPAADVQRSAGQAAPTGQATATAAQSATAVLSAPDQALQTPPPVIVWGNTNQPQAGGMGGGGQGPSEGPLLGPPTAPDANTTGPAYGKGGGGGGDGGVTTGQGQGITIPQESINSLDSSATTEPSTGAAQPNPQISGPGPILGVPPAGEGGKIIDKKLLQGQPTAGALASNGAGRETKDPASSSTPMLFGLPYIAVLQVVLALVAISAGAAAYILRRQSK